MSERHPLLYWLQLAGGEHAVREIEGREAMSAPFRFELRFTVEGGLWADPEDLLKQSALIRMERGGEHIRAVAGIVTEIVAEAKVRGVTEVSAVIEPQLALLRHRTDTRVFRDQSVPEIVTEVLRTAGITEGAADGPSRLTRRLSGAYAKRAYTVQSGEADLDFVHRLLEDEGIHYYLLERDGLVLGDSPAAYEPVPGPAIVPFRAGHGMDVNQDAINAVGRRAAASVGKVSLRDLNLDRPSLDLSASAAGPTPGGPELYDYPGEYADPAEGARKARVIAESYACAAAASSGTSLSGRLVPGHVFELEDTPGAVADGRHVVTAVRHAWKREAQGFSCAFDTLPAEVTYRPAVVTPEPRLLNPVSGIVTGPAGADIHTDPAGRVKVHFHWDRIQPYDDDCSDWIPVIQDNTGHSVAIPRVGWEVLVHFLEGDPDRPVVLGRLYNGADNFPNPLPAQKTKSALKSLSSPGRNGTNQIELDDLAGSEKITVLAEKDQNIRVANDKDTLIQNDQDVKVTRDETIDVGHDQTMKVGHDFTHGVERDQTRTVKGSRARSVKGTETSTIAKDRTLTIGSTHVRRIGTDDVVTAQDLVEQVAAVNLEAFVKTNTTTSSSTGRITVGGALIELVKDQKSESAKLRAETVGVMFSTTSGGSQSMATKLRVVTVGGAKTITAQERVTVGVATKLSFSAKEGSFDADEIMLKVGESFIQIKDGAMAINAAQTLILSGSSWALFNASGIAIIPASVASLSAAGAITARDDASASGSAHTGKSAVAVKASFDPSGDIKGPDAKGAANPAAAAGVDPATAAAAKIAHLQDTAGDAYDPAASQQAVMDYLKASDKLGDKTQDAINPGLISGIYAAEDKRLSLLERWGFDGDTIGRGQLGEAAYSDVVRTFGADLARAGVKLPGTYGEAVGNKTTEDLVVGAYASMAIDGSQDNGKAHVGRTAEDAMYYGVGKYHGEALRTAQQKAGEEVKYAPLVPYLPADQAAYNQEVIDAVKSYQPPPPPPQSTLEAPEGTWV